MGNQDVPRPARRPLQSFEIDSLEWWLKSGIWIVGVLALAVFLSGIHHRGTGGGKGSRLRDAMSNARLVGFHLASFLSRYGQMPSADTAALVWRETATDLDLGERSSNDFFRQLLAARIVETESIFYAAIDGARKLDDITTKGGALKKGECGFTYFIGARESDDPGRPILATPMIPGTDRFDPKPFDGKAILVRADGSVTLHKIIEATGLVKTNGMELMDPANPVWNGHLPVIAWPE